MTDDLIGFLQARYAEEERLARDALHPDAVNPGRWTTEHHNSEHHSEPNRCHIAEDKSGNYWTVASEVFIPNAEHMAYHDPERVLADLESKRSLLDFLDAAEAPEGEGRYVAERALLLLALPYAKHPDFRAEWQE